MRAQVRGLLTDPNPSLDCFLAAPPDVLASLATDLKHPGFPLPSTDALQQQWRSGAALGKFLAQTNADLLHGHGLSRVLLYRRAAQIAKIPLVLTLHNLVPRLSLLRRVVLRLLLQKTKIIAVSNAVANSARQIAPGCTVIYNGIDLRLFDAATKKTSNKVPIILCVARLSGEKGVDVLLSIELPGEVWIVGDGPERANLERIARPNVRFLGHRTDIPELLAAADLYVQPSRSEGLGIAILEAMAAGLPIVASSVGGIPELISDPSVGILVPPDDPKHLRDAVITLLSEPDRAATLGENARKRVAERFTLERMRTETRAIYESVQC
jgi:glycosyltransferase involved in cell wall biosynthesis